MALETPSNAIGRIDVNQLIGRPDTSIVEPRATAALTDAFRQGVITADDIVSRLGELGKSKKKAEIQQAQEFTSPEAQALRAQQVAAGTEQAQLAEVQAAKAQVLQQYPAVAYFEKFAPAAGIQAPMLPDGTPDYKQMEVIGAKLALHQAQRSEAQAKLDNIEDVVHNNTIFSKTKQGEIVDQTYVQDLRKKATQAFQTLDQMQPGAVQTAPSPVVEARTTPAATSATVEVLPSPGTRVGLGTSLGAPPPAPAKPVDPTERAQQVAAAQALIPVIESAEAAVARGGGVGPAEGSLVGRVVNNVGAALGVREQEFNDQRTLQMAISNKILEGAQVMKGNLSDKDVRFLQATVPTLSDSESTWKTYLDRWKKMAQLNVDILSGKVTKPTSDMFAPPGWEDTGVSAPAAGAAMEPVAVNSPAEAPPTAQFIRATSGPSAGKVFKNPNYRPQ